MCSPKYLHKSFTKIYFKIWINTHRNTVIKMVKRRYGFMLQVTDYE